MLPADDRSYTDADDPGTPVNDGEIPDVDNDEQPVCEDCGAALWLEEDGPRCPHCLAWCAGVADEEHAA